MAELGRKPRQPRPSHYHPGLGPADRLLARCVFDRGLGRHSNGASSAATPSTPQVPAGLKQGSREHVPNNDFPCVPMQRARDRGPTTTRPTTTATIRTPCCGARSATSATMCSPHTTATRTPDPLTGGDHMDVTYEQLDTVDAAEVIEQVIATLAQDLVCFAADMVTGSWCCTAGVLPPLRWRRAARSCDRRRRCRDMRSVDVSERTAPRDRLPATGSPRQAAPRPCAGGTSSFAAVGADARPCRVVRGGADVRLSQTRAYPGVGRQLTFGGERCAVR